MRKINCRLFLSFHHLKGKTFSDQVKKKESVQFNEPAPVRQLTRSLDLTSHLKDGVINSENKLHELVCDCLNHHNDSCTKGCCRGSNLGPSDPQAGVLTTRPSQLLPLRPSNCFHLYVNKKSVCAAGSRPSTK